MLAHHVFFNLEINVACATHLQAPSLPPGLGRCRRRCQPDPTAARRPPLLLLPPQASMDPQLRDSLQRRAAEDVAAAMALLDKLNGAAGGQAEAVRRWAHADLRRKVATWWPGKCAASPPISCLLPQRAAHRRRRGVHVSDESWAGPDARGWARLCAAPPAGEARAWAPTHGRQRWAGAGPRPHP